MTRQTLATKFQNKTALEKNSEFGKNQTSFIPKYTTTFTSEMVNQLANEQRVLHKELERYVSWFSTFQFYLIGTLGYLKLFFGKDEN